MYARLRDRDHRRSPRSRQNFVGSLKSSDERIASPTFSVATTSLSFAGSSPALHSRLPGAVTRAAEWKSGEVAPNYLDGSLPADVGCDPPCLAALDVGRLHAVKRAAEGGVEVPQHCLLRGDANLGAARSSSPRGGTAPDVRLGVVSRLLKSPNLQPRQILHHIVYRLVQRSTSRL